MKRFALVLALIPALALADVGFAFSGLTAKDLTPLSSDRVTFSDGDGLVLIDGGKAAMPIVFEEDERGSFAADYLASALEEMSGVCVEIYRLPSGATNTFGKCIFIPRPGKGDDFAVSVSGNGIRFSGRSDFAVYDFCERALGVRHYWDGPGGRSVLKGTRIEIPCLSYSDSPVFSFRRYTSRGNRSFAKVAKEGGTFDRWTQCHTTDDGFCYGSPEGFAEYCRRVDADIAGGEKFVRVVDHERRTVCVSPWDVLYACKCMWCRTLKRNLGNVTGDASTVMWERFLPRFVRYMEEKHPDYRISILPYWNYVMPPKAGTDLGTNVQAEVCSMSGLAAFKWDRVRNREEGIILDWERATGRKVANWHYSCWPAEYTKAAYVYGHTIAGHYRRMRDHVVGSYICGAKDDFPRFPLSIYVWMRCLWNPDVDVDAIYDEFCRRQFGPAAATMREVIRVQEEDWDPTTFNFPGKSLKKLYNLLTSAADQVRNTPSAPAFIYYVSGFSAAK